jgi:GH24 family phage-related lysozyme (muramidase)
MLVDHSYQYGVASTCASSMVRLVNAGQYEQACKAHTQYRFVAKYDCSTLVNGKPNKRCWGVYQRSLDRRDTCLAAGNSL